MSERKRKRKNRLRGNRTFGMGDTKNRRGSGVKGGKGRAGSKKHKFSKYYVFSGTLRKLKAKPRPKTVNIEFLEEKFETLLKQKILEEQGGFVVVDGEKLGIEKLLGKGKISKKFFVKNVFVSQKAAQKISGAGGKIEAAQGEEEK